jgi:hypothetical protein
MLRDDERVGRAVRAARRRRHVGEASTSGAAVMFATSIRQPSRS